jgi:hypothetical protein
MTVKPRTNLILDVVIFGLFVLIMISGLLVWLVYPAGGAQPGGRQGSGPVMAGESTILGVEKHAMTDLHAWLGLIMGGFVIIHLAVHWKWILWQGRRFFGVPSRRMRSQPAPETSRSLTAQQ